MGDYSGIGEAVKGIFQLAIFVFCTLIGALITIGLMAFGFSTMYSLIPLCASLFIGWLLARRL